MASISPTGASTRHLLSRRLQHAASTCPTDVAEQASAVRSLIRGQRRDAARSSREPQTPRRPYWLPERAAYVGTDLAASSTYPLCGAGRRPFARSQGLDLFTAKFLPARSSAQPSVSGQVCRRPEATLPEEQASVSRGVPAVIQ